ncbi:ATP-dependent DNA ligase [Clostridium perfringens]|nr:ATP-dependent DNA ligase [Clostridium perfringens]
MREILKIVKSLQNESSTNGKIEILRTNKDNELLKKVLYYTYNPYMKYKITEKLLNKFNDGLIIKGIYCGDIFNLLDELNRNNINDYLRSQVEIFLQGYSDDIKELYTMMLLKDLRCNISVKTINKVWKDLIPQFNVMLASKYWDSIKKVEGKEFIITTKLDGARLVCWKENGVFKAFTRQGQEVSGLSEIEKDFKDIPDGIVLDGEILLRNDENLESKDLYRATMKEVRKDGEKHNLIFNVFDILPLEDFKQGKCIIKCIDRKSQLHRLIKDNDFKNIIEVKPIYIGKDTRKIIELLDKAITNGEEGVMVNLSDAAYECKRTKTILKVKKMQTCDLEIIDFEEGTGKYKNSLGALVVDYKNNRLGVGSGFSDSDREYIWNNRKELLGRVIEVQYFEETQNQNGGFGLRFPVFKQIRELGKEVSYE